MTRSASQSAKPLSISQLQCELGAMRRHGMSVKKWLATYAFYRLTTPYRWYRLNRAAAAGQAPAVVMLFHRVAPDWANEWTTHTNTFERAIHWFKKRFEMVSLAEAQRRIRTGRNDRPCMTITFDDGYAENCDTALPLLVEEKIPCTYFVTTESVLTGQPFSHDTEMGNTFLPNTIEQLRRFADCGIEIGAHSRTHADIAQISDEHTLYDEVVTARDDLQDALGHPVRWFAFPFGAPANLSRAASRLAARHDFDGVVSAYGGYNFPGDDAFHLQRIGVDGPEVRLKNWAYWDPLKQLRLPKVDLSVLAEQVDTESEIAEVCGAS